MVSFIIDKNILGDKYKQKAGQVLSGHCNFIKFMPNIKTLNYDN